MSVGPPEDYGQDRVWPDDAAMPTRPSERGAWRHRRDEPTEETDDEIAERVGVTRTRRT